MSETKPSPSKRAKVLLMLGSMIFAMGLCELGLRIVLTPAKAVRLLDDDNRWKYVWLEGRREKQAGEQFTKVNPLMVYDSMLGWRPRPNYREAEFRVNERGVRGARVYAYEKAPGEQRIVVMGDSFTFAHSYSTAHPPIADDENFPALIEQALPNASVVNLGVPGFATDQQLLYLRQEGFQYNPDLVIVALYVDDLPRATLYFRDYAKPRFELIDGKLILKGVPIPQPEVLEQSVRARAPRSYAWAVVRLAVHKLRVDWAPLGTLEMDRLNEAIFDAMAEDVRKHGAKLLVVVIPSYEFRKKTDRAEELVGEWGRRSGVPVLQLRDAYLALPPEVQDKLYFRHWTPAGHRATADAILKKVAEEGFLKGVEAATQDKARAAPR